MAEQLPTILTNSWWVLVFPLAAFLINGLFLGRANGRAAAILAVVLNACGAGYAIMLAKAFFALGKPAVTAWNFNWLTLPDTSLSLNLGGLLDPLSVMMVVVITVIATLVHTYSIGYLRGDKGFGRFFALLPFFTFSMLGLVIASNLVQLYIFWELVGVASYALIGFWYAKPSAVAACKKAFIVTRFADAFFLIGIVLLGANTGKLNFLDLNTAETAKQLSHTMLIGGISLNVLTVGTLLVFAGGWGKSAMFPLHIWLPDAMEGPTPVSSIIHSATMVVAGVFLTARMFPLFAAANATLHIIEIVSAFTAIFTAVIACTQTDIKRILAFSTLSQLGYMMFSLGTAASAEGVVSTGYTASLFHIFTHAFFKCLLFLAAGIVIHAVHNNDLSAMGGLRKKLPLTYAATFIACLAIAGVFPFAGFFSKDEILLAAWQSGHHCTFSIGLLTGALTAFYMFRMLFLAFHGTERGHSGHVHEEPVMIVPVLILAVPSVCAGFLAKGFFAAHMTPPVFTELAGAEHEFTWIPWAATAAGLAGIGLAAFLYGRGADAVTAPKRLAGKVIYDKFYIDEAWLIFAHWVCFGMIAAPARWFDKYVVDGSMDLTAWILQRCGDVMRRVQNGQVQWYLGAMLAGLVVLYVVGGLVS